MQETVNLSPENPQPAQIQQIDSNPSYYSDTDVEKASWLPHILANDSSILALRERLLPQTGGFSFSSDKFSEQTVSESHFNKFTCLELVYQHLQAIGLTNTAETLKYESGLDFSDISQDFERTSLRILASLGISKTEKIWEIQPEPGCIYVQATPEKNCQKLLVDSSRNTISELTKIKMGTSKLDNKIVQLSQLIANLILTDLSDYDKEIIFIIIQIHVSSQHFLHHLLAIYNSDKLTDLFGEEKNFVHTHSAQLKFSTVALLAGWIRYFGTFIDVRVLQAISDFVKEAKLQTTDLQHEFSNIEFLLKEISPGKYRPLKEEPTQLPNITDFKLVLNPLTPIEKIDPEEVARQASLLFFNEFKKIPIEEFYYAFTDGYCSVKTPQINQILQMGELISLNLLEELVNSKDRLNTAQKYLVIISQLFNHSDYEASRVFLQVLKYLFEYNFLPNALPFSSIPAYWKTIGGGYPDCHEYTMLIENSVNSRKPAIPNLRIELIYTHDASLAPVNNREIDFEEHKKIAERIHRLYNFQNTPYNFWPVQSIQKMLLKKPKRTFEENLSELAC